MPTPGRLRILSGATGLGILDLVSSTLSLRSLGRSYAKLRQSLNEFSRPVREQMREVTQLPPPSTPPVGAGEEPAAPDDYPDYYDALPDEGPDEGPESDGPDDAADEPAPEAEEKRAKTPPPPSGPDIDEPPPV